MGPQRTRKPCLGEGRVVFTTFHNEAVVTPDQVAVLRHFIYIL